MRIKSLAFGLILALTGQFAFAADCAGDLRPSVGTLIFGIHLHIVNDPETGPRIEYVEEGGPIPPTMRPAFLPAQKDGRPAQSLSAHFQALMDGGALIHQSDRRLDQRNLLIPNGGLCGSTCGVNVVHAMISYLSGQPAAFSQNADYYVHRIVDETRKTFGKDAREGLTLPELASALRFLAGELRIRIYADSVFPTAQKPLTVEDLVPAEDELIIASIRKGRRADGAPAYHAIVITAAHPERNSVWFSDPNFPNSNNRVWAHEAADPAGIGTVLLNVRPSPGADGFEGMIHDMLRVRVARE